MTLAWLIPAMAYLLGSIPFGYLIVKLSQKRDIRAAGSGNIGAANVTRIAGAGPGLLTLLLDAAKGYGAVYLAAALSQGSIRWMMLAAVLAIVGHMFPVWLRFRGGRGVATAAGVYLPICPAAVGAALLVWVLVVAFWRYASLASISAAAASPLLIYFLYAPGHAPPYFISLGAVLISILIIWKHRPNLARLIAGTENRLNFRR